MSCTLGLAFPGQIHAVDFGARRVPRAPRAVPPPGRATPGAGRGRAPGSRGVGARGRER